MSNPTSTHRHHELSDFLRSRRERLSPEQVGLVSAGRRRTPGLRREEVAMLAGVSTTWYTWLEQGREIQVSVQVIEALGEALRLTPNERNQLARLAGREEAAPERPDDEVHPQRRLLLTALEPYPAFIANSRGDLLAYNSTYNILVGTPVDDLPRSEHNCLLLAFLYPQWRKAMGEHWEASVGFQIASARARMTMHGPDATWNALVARLRRESPEFEEFWQRFEFCFTHDPIVKTYTHPVAGTMSFHAEHAWLQPSEGTRQVTYFPVDEVSAEHLRHLAELAGVGNLNPAA